MPVADEVVVKLEALIAGYKANLTDANNHFNRTASQIEARNKTMSDRVRTHSLAMATAVGTFIGTALGQLPGAMVRAAEASLEYAGSLGETAQQLGVTSKALQEYRFIGSQVGIETEQMDKALSFFTKTMGQVQDGAKKPIAALKDLGFNAKDIARISHEGADAIPELADAFAKIEDPAKRAALEVVLFSRAGQRMDTLLTQGASGVNGLRDAIERMGGVLTDEQIRKADDAADKFAALKAVLSARISGVVADNAGAILGLANALVVLIGKLGTALRAYQAFAAGLGIAFNKIQSIDPTAGVAGRREGRLGVAEYSSQLRDLQGQYAGRGSFADRAAAFRSRLSGTGGKTTPHTAATNEEINAIGDAMRAKDLQTGGGGGPTAEDRVKKAKETLARYLDETNSLQQKINSTTADELGTQEARFAAEKANIDLQEQQDIRHIQDDEDYSAAQKAALISQQKVAAEKQKQALEEAYSTKLAADITETSVAHFKNQEDILRAEEQLSDDRNRRAEIEKRLIDLAMDEEKAQLQLIIATSKNAEEVDRARERMATLGQLSQLQKAGVDRENRSPGQKYLDELQSGLRNVNDTIQDMEVEQVKKLEDFLAGSTVKALGLHGALGEVADTLIRIGLQRGLIEPLANMLFGGGASGGGGGLGGLLGALGGLFGGGTTPGGASSLLNTSTFSYRAAGGPVRAGQPYIVGEKGPEPFIPSTAGTILPNSALGGASSVEVIVTAGEYFDARVNRVTGPVIAKTSMRAAVGGSQLARQSLTNDALHRLD